MIESKAVWVVWSEGTLWQIMSSEAGVPATARVSRGGVRGRPRAELLAQGEREIARSKNA